MHRVRFSFGLTAAGGLVLSGLAAISACAMEETDSQALIGYAGTPDDSGGGPKLGEVDVEREELDGGLTATDASDAGDGYAPPSPACGSLGPMGCNFDDPCYELAGIGAGGTGLPTFVTDAGVDASTAFRAYVANGGVARYGLPFQQYDTEGPTAPIVGCKVTCEGKVRIVSGHTETASIVIGGEGETFKLGIASGAWVQTSPDAGAESHTTPVSSEWLRFTVVLTPTGTGSGGTSAITLTTEADASTTTTTTIPAIGQQMRFGVETSATSPVEALFDDIVCRPSE